MAIPSTAATVEPVHPLQPGDRLTRPEFERRFDATPNLKKAELIDGIVYIPSCSVEQDDLSVYVRLGAWLGGYVSATPGTRVDDSPRLRFSTTVVAQPDAVLTISPQHGGQARIDADGYAGRGPELVAEIAATTASYDLHQKLEVYRRFGVREYLVWRTLDEAIDWFVLREGRFDRLPADSHGLYRSEVFPGLWLDVPAMLAHDLQRVNAVLQEGLATEEHAQFAQRLARRLNR